MKEQCKTNSNSDCFGMGGGRGSLLGEGEKREVQSISEEDVLRSVGNCDADRGGRGNGKQPSRKRCLSVKLNGQQFNPSKGSGSSAQSSSNVMNRRHGRVRFDNRLSVEGHDGGTATLTLHCEAKIDGTCKVNSKALEKGDKKVLKAGDMVYFSFIHNGDNDFTEYIIEEEDTIAGYKLKEPGGNMPLQQSIGKTYENNDDMPSTSHSPAASQQTLTVSKATSERVRQMEMFMECPICAGFMVNPILTVPCGHSFCSTCWSGLGLIPHCPTCRSIVTDTALNRGLNSFIELMVAAGPRRNSVIENGCLNVEDVAHYKLRVPHCHSSHSPPPYTVHFQTKTSQNRNQNNISSSRSAIFGEERYRASLSSPQQDRQSRKRVVIDLT